MPVNSEDILYCRVLTHIGETDFKSMGILPPEDITEEIAIKFSQIRYVVSEGKYSKIAVMDGTVWITTMPVDEAFLAWSNWQKKNPGK